HDLPARLAIADQDGLAVGARMPSRDLLDKAGFGLADIRDRLTGYRLRRKTEKIAGVASLERHADLAVVLHAADPGTMPGSRVENDEGAFVPIDRRALWGDDANQPVIHRPRQSAAVE